MQKGLTNELLRCQEVGGHGFHTAAEVFLAAAFAGLEPLRMKISSWQVSGVLQELGVNHRTEERLKPYVADVRITLRQRLIEIDGA